MSDTSPETAVTAFHFDRYINGTLMAEGVTIEKQPDLQSAMQAAAKIASRGPQGEVPVLVHRAEDASARSLIEPEDQP